MASSQQQGIGSSVDVAASVARGVGAFFFGLVFVAVLFFVSFPDAIEALGMPGGFQRVLALVVGVFFGTHLGAVQGSQIVLGSGAGTIPGFVFYLVPVLSLVSFGRSAAAVTGTDDPAEGALAGAAVAAGYLAALLLTVVGLQAIFGGSFGSGLVQLLLVAGLVYPAVFGAVGGAIAATLSSGAAGRGRAGQPQAGQRGGQPAAGGGRQGAAGGRQQATGGRRSAGGGPQGGGREAVFCSNCGAASRPEETNCSSCGAQL